MAAKLLMFEFILGSKSSMTESNCMCPYLGHEVNQI